MVLGEGIREAEAAAGHCCPVIRSHSNRMVIKGVANQPEEIPGEVCNFLPPGHLLAPKATSEPPAAIEHPLSPWDQLHHLRRSHHPEYISSIQLLNEVQHVGEKRYSNWQPRMYQTPGADGLVPK